MDPLDGQSRGGFRGGGDRLLLDFLVKTFQKVPKSTFLACVFEKFCLRRRHFGQNMVLPPKKMSTKLSIFLKSK